MKKALTLVSIALLLSAPFFVQAARDRTNPRVTSIHIESQGISPSWAKTGDKVVIKFTTSEKVQKPIVLVESRVLIVIAKNTGGNSWEASYTVQPRDPQGKVDYLITLADMSNNISACSSRQFFFLDYCPTTDGSSVTVDRTPPVIAVHEDITAAAESSAGATVIYALPAVTDNKDTSVTVSCAPTSGTLFGVGNTTVTCSAQDDAGNVATSTTFLVTVTPFIPAPDTAPPIMETIPDITAQAPDTVGTVVSFILPIANDDRYGPVPVICTPASGSFFPVGITLVTCTASDTAGNSVQSTFNVNVLADTGPTEVTIAQHLDESVQGILSSVINLGQGSSLGSAGIASVTLSLDTAALTPAQYAAFASNPWNVYLICYTDSGYANLCTDWATANAWNGGISYLISEQATTTANGRYWTAYFTDVTHSSNASDGTNPVVFNPNYFYQLFLDTPTSAVPSYGSAAGIPYYVIRGLK